MKNKALNYLTLIIVIAAFPALVFLYFREGYPGNIYTWTGLSLMLPSLVLFTIARIQLGKSFQVSAKATSLVTGGIYRKFRHPIYLFGLIFLAGVIVFVQKFILLVVLCGIVFLQKRRIHKEEMVLEEKFGEQYLTYKKGTWF